MSDKVAPMRGFVAFPSRPRDQCETLAEAVARINAAGEVSLECWTDVVSAGRLIIGNVCDAIEDRPLFVCDLSFLNPNVLFELGFAIARQKRIWILLDSGRAGAVEAYRAMRVLMPVSFANYENSGDIESAFHRERPHATAQATLFADLVNHAATRAGKAKLLYVRSRRQTDAVVRLTARLRKSRLPLVVDDASEVPDRPLSWYVRQMADSYAVVVHLQGTAEEGALLYNAKASLIAGIAHGLGKYVLMLAHAPFASPVDYAELLQVHETAAQCIAYADTWLEHVEHDYRQRRASGAEETRALHAQALLQQLTIGDPMAEVEAESLETYFIPTASYAEALRAQEALVVGRTGTGKTAMMLRAAAELSADRRNLVCVVQPDTYYLTGFMRAVAEARTISEQGFLVESLWKLLIYTEIARSLEEELRSRPPGTLDEAEQRLLAFADANSLLMAGDFGLRLERVLEDLRTVSRATAMLEQRVRTSQILHETSLRELRGLLGECLHKRNRVAILVDNLDKAWSRREDAEGLRDILWGLLSLQHKIWMDFRKQDHWRRGVNVSIAVFLRSDIFLELLRDAPERHKISFTKISWDDPTVLLRLLDKRLALAAGGDARPDEVWERYFCRTVRGVPTKEYLLARVVPRPRDLIFLVKAAIAQAVNRGNARVEEQDVISAEAQYSMYAVTSVYVEGASRFPGIEGLLSYFLGQTPVVLATDVQSHLAGHGLSGEESSELLKLLVELGFLGLETGNGRFEFAYDREAAERNWVKAERSASRSPEAPLRYMINVPFHSYLEIAEAEGPAVA